jgi:hypothetical protein
MLGSTDQQCKVTVRPSNWRVNAKIYTAKCLNTRLANLWTPKRRSLTNVALYGNTLHSGKQVLGQMIVL